MNLNFLPITPDDLTQYKRDMQEAFRFGAIEGGFPDEGEILPEKDIDRSLNKKGAAAYKAVLDGKIVGGAIVVIDEEKGEGGFGYDCLFCCPDYNNRTFAEITQEEKNAVSHRGRAMEILRQVLTEMRIGQ